MALYDQRTFKWRDTWWVAEVHSAVGAGTGSVIPRATTERVIFTSLSDPEAPSRSSAITAGSLNRLKHSAVGRLVDAAESWGSRFAMSPRNAPDADELSRKYRFIDEEGLTWVYRQTERAVWDENGATLRPALELICLDDSALHGEVGFLDRSTLDDFLAHHGEDGVRSLVPLVTHGQKDLPSHWDK